MLKNQAALQKATDLVENQAALQEETNSVENHAALQKATDLVTREQLWEALCRRHTREVQEKLAAGRVAICGLGGLGSNVAVALARMGVGALHLIDFDRVDLTNLNRQQYTVAQVGRYKTEALSEYLLQINPYLEIRTETVKLDEALAVKLLAEDDIICEAFDVAEAKAMLVNTVLEHFPQKPVVAGSGLAGYESSNTIQTRRVFGRLYVCGDGTTDMEEGFGLMAPRAAICGAHQANMIVRLLLGLREP